MTIFEQVNEGIKEAMKSRNKVRLDALRMLKSKILAVNARGELPDSEVIKLFKTYHGNLQEALEHAQTAQRTDLIDQLKIEQAVIQEFLPKALSPEETKTLIIQAVSESGAKSKKDLGLVMKSVMKLNNSVDGKMAKDLASQLLPD